MHHAALEVFERGGRTGRREIPYVLSNLAACLHLQGRREEAAEIAREAVVMQRRMLGVEHPDVVLSEANLALMCHGNRMRASK